MVEGFGQRVRSFRNGLGLTQVELAERLGISKQTLANMESGAQGTSLEVLAVLRRLGADLNWLIDGTEE